MIYTIDMLENLIKKSKVEYDEEKISEAYKVAEKAHFGQTRKSGEPYIAHPVAVSCILVELCMDTDSICAALMHDVVEDTSYTIEQIARQFGTEVAHLVQGVTKITNLTLIQSENSESPANDLIKISRMSSQTKEALQAENIRRMLIAMSEDIRVIIIKLADRLHNMRTLEFVPEHKQREISLETMEIYAPLAHRLGIRALQEELQDKALLFLDPVAYKEIDEILETRKGDTSNYIEFIKMRIRTRLPQNLKDSEIEGRIKSRYGIFKKVYGAGHTFDQVYDIFAVRVIVRTVSECYIILGIIHDIFTPVPNRFKDYISMPKTNMYQSLHTTVLGNEGMPFEVQIRTRDMHNTAEYGIAAHWKYKAGIKDQKLSMDERFKWIKNIVEAPDVAEDSTQIIRNIKVDIGSDELFVLTPKGKVIRLPAGSTTVDFAYAIHSAVGNRMIGAKINGKNVKIDTEVQTGQIVEIITTNAQNHGPGRDWLKFVRTSEARSKIRTWFKKERREENIISGREEVEREFKRNGIILDNDKLADFISAAAKRHKFETADDFYSAIGYGGIVLSKIIPKIKEEYNRLYKADQAGETEINIELSSEHERAKASGVIVDGINDCSVKFSKCCNPLPGDDIIGFITIGHGVSVHKQDCVNVILMMSDEKQSQRFIKTSWAKTESSSFRSTLCLTSVTGTNYVLPITMFFAGCKIPVYELSAKELKNGNNEIIVTIGISGIAQLKNIIERISKIEGIISVERTGK